MKNHINNAQKSIYKREYSMALTQIYSIYHRFYAAKRKIILSYSNKSFLQIANSDCVRYKNWRTSFYSVDNKAEEILKIIENHSASSGKKFVTADGDNILKNARAMRNHCNLFASMRKITEKTNKEEEYEKK